MDVNGQVVEWVTPFVEETGEGNGGLYVWEHAGMSRAKLSFLERDGVRFRFEWAGVGDVFWDEEYGEDVPFSAAGWAEFTGVYVYGSEYDTTESMRERLATYLEPSDFIDALMELKENWYESGVRMADATYLPTNTSLRL